MLDFVWCIRVLPDILGYCVICWGIGWYVGVLFDMFEVLFDMLGSCLVVRGSAAPVIIQAKQLYKNTIIRQETET